MSKEVMSCDEALIQLAIESWRLARLFERAVARMDAGEGERYVGQIRYFRKQLERNLEGSGISLVNVEGQPFDAGMAATPVNLDDFGPDVKLIVDKMIEPIVMGSEGVLRTGTVSLRKV